MQHADDHTDLTLETSQEVEQGGYTPSFDIYDYIPFRLVQAQMKMHASLRPESAPEAQKIATLSQTEFRVLVLVASKGPMAPSDVASEYGFDRAVVTRAMSSLVRKGMLLKERQATNQRSKLAQLTALGIQYVEYEFNILRDYGQHLDQSLTASEKKQLFQLLNKLEKANASYPRSVERER